MKVSRASYPVSWRVCAPSVHSYRKDFSGGWLPHPIKITSHHAQVWSKKFPQASPPTAAINHHELLLTIMNLLLTSDLAQLFTYLFESARFQGDVYRNVQNVYMLSRRLALGQDFPRGNKTHLKTSSFQKKYHVVD